MCQCIMCDCWWINCCEVCLSGLSISFFLLECWLCKPNELQRYDNDCCHVCTWVGYGGTMCCVSSILCAPDPVKYYSAYLSTGDVGKPYPGSAQNFHK